jgi:Class II flagellar assembly regulator
MKVGSSSGVNGAGAAYAPSRPAAGGFSLASAGGASDAAPMARTAGPTGVTSLDVLLALQEVDGPLERRRKAVRRAGRILDVLDEVKLALLDGHLPPAALERLMAAVREERGGADDPRLEGLLDEIETRAAVELAKLEMAKFGKMGAAA